MKQAVVVGALGVIGRYIVERLLAAGDWNVVGLSRRAAPSGPRYQHIAVDLLDTRDANAKLAGYGRHARLLRRISGGDGCGRWLCLQHRPQPRHAGQLVSAISAAWGSLSRSC